MERTFPAKSAVLVANTANTIAWTAPDITPRFYESIIKRPVAIRFTCTTTTPNSVNVGVRYTTLSKDYQIAERQTLFIIPPNSSVEITSSTIPALALLYENVTSITCTLICATGGTVTITLIVDDEPPPLTTDPGEKIGLDSKFSQDYLLVNQVANQVCNAGTNNTLINYTVPSGKRFYLDLLTGYIEPTPSFPEYVTWSAYLPVPNISAYYVSRDDEGYSFIALQNSGYIFQAGDTIQVDAFNGDTTAHTARAFMIGREVF